MGRVSTKIPIKPPRQIDHIKLNGKNIDLDNIDEEKYRLDPYYNSMVNRLKYKKKYMEDNKFNPCGLIVNIPKINSHPCGCGAKNYEKGICIYCGGV